MGPRPLFVLFGIPVTVDLWFFFGLFIFYSLSGGGTTGLYTAIGIGIFVLIHELGHTLTARRFGAQPTISLNFLVGWASYSAGTRLSRWQRNVISVMGPVTQILVATLAMWIVRLAIPLSEGMSEQSLRMRLDLENAIAWAGIMLAGLNLLPLWPLDGGHIVESLIRGRFGIRGTKLFLQWTLAASAFMIISSFTSSGNANAIERWATNLRVEALTDAVPLAVGKLLIVVPAIAASATPFIAIFTALGAYQALNGLRVVSDPVRQQNIDRKALAQEPVLRETRTGERHGWTGPEPGPFPRSMGPSPWLEAALARRRGAPPEEVTRLLGRLAQPRRNWVVDDMSRPELGDLLPFVPPAVQSSPAVIEARVFHGPAEDLVAGALATHRGSDEAEAFYAIAEGMAERGLHDDAMSWLTGAVERKPDPRRVATSRQLSVLHGRSDFQQLLGVAERAVAPPRGR